MKDVYVLHENWLNLKPGFFFLRSFKMRIRIHRQQPNECGYETLRNLF
jgi:hypothetical protein